jgi:hypothetical protein
MRKPIQRWWNSIPYSSHSPKPPFPFNFIKHWWNSIPHPNHPLYFQVVAFLPLFFLVIPFLLWILSLIFHSSDIYGVYASKNALESISNNTKAS